MGINIGGSNALKKIYIWVDVQYSRVLYDETDFANSSISKNGKLTESGWGVVGGHSNISFNSGGYISSTSSHSKLAIHFNSTAYSEIASIEKVKIVYDRITVNSTSNRYGSYIDIFGAQGHAWSSSWSFPSSSTVTYTLSSGTGFAYNTYTGVLEYDLVNDSGTLTITDTSSNVSVYTITGGATYWTLTSSASFFINGTAEGTDNSALGGIVMDQGASMDFGNMHIYIRTAQ